jgi:hypothetical protein
VAVDLDRVEFVRALEVPTGAVLAVKANRKLTVEQVARIEAQLRERLPGHPVIVLPPDLDLVVVYEVAVGD